MRRGVPVFRCFIFFHALLAVVAIQPADNEDIGDGKVRIDSPEACASMNCSGGELCVVRKFWCKDPPCPTMLYCSKSRRESWKGPRGCDSVRCSRGHVCLVKVRRCRRNRECRQRIARCVSQSDYHDTPAASCAGFKCPTGHRCILRESPCPNPPCRLIEICAKVEDLATWHNECRSLGCPSEYECFLRRQLDDCPVHQPCDHRTVDCTSVANASGANPICRGWVCPRNEECASLRVPESCDPAKEASGSCGATRVCRGSLDIGTTFASSTTSIPRIDVQLNGDSQMETSEIEEELEMREKTRFADSPPSNLDAISIDRPTERAEPILGADRAPTQSRRDLNCSRDESLLFSAQIEPLKPQRASIYQTPVYVGSAAKNNVAGSVETSCRDRGKDPSITEWLDHLRLRTGVDAVEAWAKHAERNAGLGRFDEWLESVKSTLGASKFKTWLTEFRKSISEHPALQDRLSAVGRTSPPPGHHEESPSEGDDGPSTVSVTQRSSDHPSGRKYAGHSRINYGLNPRNAYQQMHRGFVKSRGNSTQVEWKDESSTRFGSSDSTQSRSARGEETDTTVSKLGGLVDFLKSRNEIESNSSREDSTKLLTRQDNNDTRLEYDRANESLLLPHERKENVENSSSAAGESADEENGESDTTNPGSDTRKAVDPSEKRKLFAPAGDGLRVIFEPRRRTYHPVPSIPQEGVEDSWRQIFRPELYSRESLPRISDLRAFEAETEAEGIDSGNRKSSSSKQKQDEEKLSSYEKIVPQNPNQRKASLPPGVGNFDLEAGAIGRHSSPDSRSPERTSRPVDSQSKHLGNSEGDFEEYESDLNLDDYPGSYLDTFVKDAVLKLLMSDSLQRNESDQYSQDIDGATIEAIDDDYHEIFPEHRHNDFGIPRRLETVQHRINDVLTDGEDRQATVTPPILTGIDRQSYDCEEDQNSRLSPTVRGIDESPATEGEHVARSSKSYGVDRRYYYYDYYVDEIEGGNLDRVVEYGDEENYSDEDN